MQHLARLPSLRLALVAPLLLLVASSACRSGKVREDPILRLSAEEAFELGEGFMAQEKYNRAREHFTHAFEVGPNSRLGREALLLAADASYLQGGTANFITCEAKYRDFLNRFPTSDRADYAQLQVGNCLAARMEKPDRDQQATRQALTAFAELRRLYPGSAYVEQADTQIEALRDQLALHELTIATFYLRYGRGGLCNASIQRLETVREDYPDFTRMDQALYELARAYTRCEQHEQAQAVARELRERYPASELTGDADAVLESPS